MDTRKIQGFMIFMVIQCGLLMVQGLFALGLYHAFAGIRSATGAYLEGAEQVVLYPNGIIALSTGFMLLGTLFAQIFTMPQLARKLRLTRRTGSKTPRQVQHVFLLLLFATGFAIMLGAPAGWYVEYRLRQEGYRFCHEVEETPMPFMIKHLYSRDGSCNAVSHGEISAGEALPSQGEPKRL